MSGLLPKRGETQISRDAERLWLSTACGEGAVLVVDPDERGSLIEVMKVLVGTPKVWVMMEIKSMGDYVAAPIQCKNIVQQYFLHICDVY